MMLHEKDVVRLYKFLQGIVGDENGLAFHKEEVTPATSSHIAMAG